MQIEGKIDIGMIIKKNYLHVSYGLIGFCYHECVGISDLADCPEGGVGLTLQAARQKVRSNLSAG